jgi:glycosyltransferase involved in cell wall biosynthesis
LFLGAYNHPPNRISFKFRIDKILPELIKTANQFKIHIIGYNIDKFTKNLSRFIYKDFVTMRGFVKDINEAFDDMDIALFPILYVGGIKTKVIDAMASDLPVVTTPQGVMGLINLPQNAVGVCSTTNEILSEINALMNNYSLRLKRSEIGQNYIENQYSYKIFSKKLKMLIGIFKKEESNIS